MGLEAASVVVVVAGYSSMFQITIGGVLTEYVLGSVVRLCFLEQDEEEVQGLGEVEKRGQN